MIVKIHDNGSNTIIAICDSKNLGKIYSKGDFILDASSDFFKGIQMDSKELLMKLHKADSVYAIGDKSTEFLVKNKILSKDNVKFIDGIPYTIVVLK